MKKREFNILKWFKVKSFYFLEYLKVIAQTKIYQIDAAVFFLYFDWNEPLVMISTKKIWIWKSWKESFIKAFIVKILLFFHHTHISKIDHRTYMQSIISIPQKIYNFSMLFDLWGFYLYEFCISLLLNIILDVYIDLIYIYMMCTFVEL